MAPADCDPVSPLGPPVLPPVVPPVVPDAPEVSPPVTTVVAPDVVSVVVVVVVGVVVSVGITGPVVTVGSVAPITAPVMLSVVTTCPLLNVVFVVLLVASKSTNTIAGAPPDPMIPYSLTIKSFTLAVEPDPANGVVVDVGVLAPVPYTPPVVVGVNELVSVLPVVGS